MASWDGGYFSESDYETTFFSFITPDMFDWIQLQNGIVSARDGAFSWLDLGCGTGYQNTVLAAMYPEGRFTGVDFLPTHIAEARDLVIDAGLDNAEFLEMSFSEYINHDDGVMFDYIILHGIMCWVDEGARAEILQIVERRLKPGGTVYIGYSALPGAACEISLRKALIGFAKESGQTGVSAAESAFKEIAALQKVGSKHIDNNRDCQKFLGMYQTIKRNFSLHDEFIDCWRAFSIQEMVDYFDTAKLEFVNSCDVLQAWPTLVLDKDQMDYLLSRPDPIHAEFIKDMMLNITFRQDLMMRGARKMSKDEWAAQLRQTMFAKARPDHENDHTWNWGSTTIVIDKKVWTGVMEALDSGAKNFQELENIQVFEGISINKQLQTLSIMAARGAIAPIVRQAGLADAEQLVARCQRMNAALLNRVQYGKASPALATPTFRRGIALTDIHMLMLTGAALGQDSIEFTLAKLMARDEPVVVNDREYTKESDVRNLLEQEFTGFQQHFVPFLNKNAIP